MDKSHASALNDSRWKIIIYLFSCGLIIFLCCKDMSNLNYIVVLNDEFGYWGTAASIVGFDWKELIAETPYYSYGYSLLLVPIILLLPTPIVWYKTAIILNVMLLLLSCFIGIKVGKELFPEIDDKFIMLVSILITIYPGNITYAQVAWSETLQYFLIWCITYLMVKLDKEFSAIYISGIVILLIYLFCVHNRNIGVLAVAMVCILLCFLKHNKSVLLFAIPVAFIILGYLFVRLIKNYEVEVLWSNSAASEVNDLSISGVTFSKYFSIFINDFVLFMESVYGKLFYLLLATGFTFPVIVFNIAKEAVSNARQRKIFKDFFISKVWSVGILVIMWFLTALKMMNWTTRKDVIVYARYMEQAIGPVLLLGIIYTFFYIKNIRVEFLLSIILFLIGVKEVYYKISSAESYFNAICAPLLSAFINKNNVLEKAFAWMIIVMQIMLGGVIVSTFVRNKTFKFVLPIIVFIIVFSVEGFYASSNYINRRQNDVKTNIVPIYEQIIQFDQNEIYYLKDTTDDKYSVNPKYLQFLIPKHKIHLIEREEINSIMGNETLILINPQDKDTKNILLNDKNVKKLVSTKKLVLYIKQDS